MRNPLAFLVGLAMAATLPLWAPVHAQQATLNTPVTRNAEHNLRAETVYISRDNGGRWEIQVSIRDSGGAEIRREVYSGPDAAHTGATALACATAYTSARSGETGGTARRLDFRLLGFLSDQGYIPNVTLVP